MLGQSSHTSQRNCCVTCRSMLGSLLVITRGEKSGGTMKPLLFNSFYGDQGDGCRSSMQCMCLSVGVTWQAKIFRFLEYLSLYCMAVSPKQNINWREQTIIYIVNPKAETQKRWFYNLFFFLKIFLHDPDIQNTTTPQYAPIHIGLSDPPFLPTVCQPRHWLTLPVYIDLAL